MDFKSKEFKDLKDKWYKKAAKSGFKDIEQDEDNLIVWASHLFRATYDATKFQAKEEYYRAAGHFLHDYEFDSKRDRLVWEKHAEGLSIAKIVKELKKKNRKIHKMLVHEIIKRLASEMTSKWKL